MKRKLWILSILLMLIMLFSMAAVVNHYKYRQDIGNIQIVHYIVSGDGNLDYFTVRLNVVLPEKKCYGNITMNLIRILVIARHEKIPNRIDIIFYDSMEKLKDGEKYAEKTFHK